MQPKPMIIEDRDPVFWEAVAEHPMVKPHVTLGRAFRIKSLIEHPLVTPLRCSHGGFLMVRLDTLGRIYDLHALFVPEGWGRIANASFKQALAEMFRRGADVIVSLEVADWWRSRPPLSFGFRPAGDVFERDGLNLRTWQLTRAAWESSPARRRME